MTTAQQVKPSLEELQGELAKLTRPWPWGFRYFLQTYVSIEDRKFTAFDPVVATIPWEWWPVHEDFLGAVSNRLLIILKARQISVSWFLAAYRLYNALFNNNYFYMIISQGEDYAQEALRKSRFIYDHLPPWLKPGLVSDNKGEIVIGGTQGTIRAFPSTIRGGASYTASCIETDEAAHHEYAAENYAAYTPAIDIGGQHIIVSTANGYGNWFERMYHGAKAGQSPYVWRFYGWPVRPGRDGAWYEERRQAFVAAGEGDKLQQEYPLTDEEAFRVSGYPRFNPEVIQASLENARPGLSSVPDALREIPGLTLWKLPIAGQPYVMFSDPAEGLPHGDNAVTQVVVARTLEHVATIKGKWEPGYFAQISATLGRFYNMAFWGIERNNHGHVVLRVASEDLRYPRLYWHQDRLRTFQQLASGTQPPQRLGFPTTSETRPGLIDDLAAVIDTYALQSPSRSFWEECRTFVRDEKGQGRAVSGACDDEVMSMAGARRMAMQPGATSLAPMESAGPMQLRYSWGF